MPTDSHENRREDHGRGPLDGVRVLDLTRVLAGPFSTQVLADLGAEVLKVERPGKGDESRYSGPKAGGESTHFMTANRNKRSIVLDLKNEDGLRVARELAARCDVLVENFRPGVLRRLLLSYDQLKADMPGLIVCSISGFGGTGPLRDRPSFDVVTQAMTGAMAVTGEMDGPPVRLGAPMGDIAGGMFGAIAVLAALHRRSITGVGGPIDISLYDSMMSVMHYYYTDQLLTGKEPPKVGSGNPSIYPYGGFRANDGFIVVAAFQTSFWRRLCDALGMAELARDERFATNDLRVEHKSELSEMLTKVFRTKSRAEWCEILDREDIPNAPILSVGEVARHPHAIARQMIEEVEHPKAGRLRITGRPIKYPGQARPPLRPAPILGEHTEEILTGLLGYDRDDISKLVASGATSLDRHGTEV